MVKEESLNSAAQAAAEKHFAMHGLYGLPPTSGAMPPSPQTQRPVKLSSNRDEPPPDDVDFLTAPHSKLNKTTILLLPLLPNRHLNYSRK